MSNNPLAVTQAVEALYTSAEPLVAQLALREQACADAGGDIAQEAIQLRELRRTGQLVDHGPLQTTFDQAVADLTAAYRDDALAAARVKLTEPVKAGKGGK